MTWWCASLDEVYGIFPLKKFAVAEALKHFEVYKVRKINPGFYEYRDKLASESSTTVVWVMTEFEAILNGFNQTKQGDN